MTRSCYSVTLSTDRSTRRAALALRAAVFRNGRWDEDRFDDGATHGVVRDSQTGRVVCCFRLMAHGELSSLTQSYSACFFDLGPIEKMPGAKLELGRFAVARDCRDPEVLRYAWAAITAELDRIGAVMLFGCASFPGAAPQQHGALLGLLASRHAGPPEHVPGRKPGQNTVDMVPANDLPLGAMTGLPSLLRAYLAMGGWVSDHAVADNDLDTTLVLCVMEVDHVPAPRRARLRELAAEVTA